MKTILVDAIFTFISPEGEIFEEMYKMLEEFPNRKIILTGADYEATNQYGLNDAPYEVFTLKHNPEKTDPRYYEMMLEHFGLKAKDVIYFEHGEEAVASAQSVGIKTYFYDTEKKELIGLKKFLVDNLR
jgi:HAD superfamily hydrolase (TIGR01509 family)